MITRRLAALILFLAAAWCLLPAWPVFSDTNRALLPFQTVGNGFWEWERYSGIWKLNWIELPAAYFKIGGVILLAAGFLSIGTNSKPGGSHSPRPLGEAGVRHDGNLIDPVSGATIKE